jgi:hypothetical protein
MRKLLTLILVLCSIVGFAQMRGGALYDPGAARSNLSNVDATATPSMTSITLSDKIRAAWADILGDIYASGTVKVSTGTAAAPAYSFASDPDTGIYRFDSDQIGFAANGRTFMRGLNDLVDFGSQQAGSSTFRIYTDPASAYVEIQGLRKDVAFDSPLVLQRQGGNVLIGTSTDDGANKLQVNGSAKFYTGNCKFLIREVDLVDDESVDVATLFGIAEANGILRVFSRAGAAGDVQLTGASNVVVIGIDYSSFDSADTDGNLCVYSTGSGNYVIKNRLGGSFSHIVTWQGME